MADSEPIHCILEHGLEVFGGKWKSRIICVLYMKGTMRYHELSKELVNISNKVLSSVLRELVSDGIISRTEIDAVHPKVEYSLTEKGLSVVPILKSIADWGGMYLSDGSDDRPLCKKCDYRDYVISSFAEDN